MSEAPMRKGPTYETMLQRLATAASDNKEPTGDISYAHRIRLTDTYKSAADHHGPAVQQTRPKKDQRGEGYNAGTFRYPYTQLLFFYE